jgi:hypothetical protein
MRAAPAPRNQAHTEQEPASPGVVRPGGGRLLAKLAGVLILGGFAILLSGIALGNAARKRVDRWMRGY